MERVIITPELLIKTFKNLPIDVFLYILAPFTAKEEKAKECWNTTIKSLKDMPASTGRKSTLEVFEHLKSAYEKMTIFEREHCRKGLVDKLAKHFTTYNPYLNP